MASDIAQAVKDSQTQIKSKRAVPRGTTDVVMSRLFPERRSKVPVDEERQAEVYAILKEVGAIEEADEQGVERDSEDADGTQVLDARFLEDHRPASGEEVSA